MRSPIKYYGGKGKLALPIISAMPRHHAYVELFGGSGAVLFAKPPAIVEVYNDLDEDVVNFFRVLRDPAMANRLRTLLELTPYARAEHACCRRLRTDDSVERARCYFVRIRQSINGIVDGSWRYSRQPGGIDPFFSSLPLIAAATQRLRGVYIENRDALELIDVWDRAGVLMYADPPYLAASRVAPDVYARELTSAQHHALLDRLTRCRAMVLLSGYDNSLYASTLSGWSRIELPTRCWSTPAYDPNGERRAKGDRVEVLWLNPQAAQRLAEDKHPMMGRLTLVEPTISAVPVPNVPSSIYRLPPSGKMLQSAVPRTASVACSPASATMGPRPSPYSNGSIENSTCARRKRIPNATGSSRRRSTGFGKTGGPQRAG